MTICFLLIVNSVHYLIELKKISRYYLFISSSNGIKLNKIENNICCCENITDASIVALAQPTIVFADAQPRIWGKLKYVPPPPPPPQMLQDWDDIGHADSAADFAGTVPPRENLRAGLLIH